MRKLLILAVVAFFATTAHTQANLFSAGLCHTAAAPTFNPGAKGCRLVLDTTTQIFYQWKIGTTWDAIGSTIDLTLGCVPPVYTPNKWQSDWAVNGCDSLYHYRGGAWRHANAGGGSTYTAGTGIAISGSNVISNTGDLSNTNELITDFEVTGGSLVVSDAGGGHSVAVTDIAPIQSGLAAEFNQTGSVLSLDYTNAQKATALVPGFLTAADWTTFNNKLSVEVDGSITNEIQTLSFANPNLSISGGNTVDLSGLTPTQLWTDGTQEIYPTDITDFVSIGTTTADRLFHVESADAVTNAVTYEQRLSHITSGTATTGFGAGTEVELENGSGTNRVAATQEVTWSDAGDATEDADLNFKLMRAGALTTQLTVLSTGRVGIGTAIPAATIESKSSSTSTDMARFTNAAGSLRVYSDIYNAIHLASTATDSRLYLESTGFGSLIYWDYAAAGLTMKHYAQLTSENLLTVQSQNTITTGRIFRVLHNTTEVLSVTGNERVGIGVTTPSEVLSVAGNVQLTTPGNKLKIATGSNASIGTSTLVAGTVTVSTTAVATASKIFVSVDTPGGTVGFISAPSASIVNATSFVINSSNAADTSTVNWWIVN